MLRASLPAFAADFPVRHGRVSGYQRGCRCAPCVAANRAAGRAWRARQPAKVRTPRARTAGHGVSWYANGVCRCEVCRSAGTAARAVSRARRRAQVVAVAGCPRCGAPAGLPCQGRAGPRVALHRERWTAAVGSVEMPKATDSDLNRAADAPIELVEVVECPACAGEFDAVFVTDARDEDGLADLVEVTAELVCPDCGRRFEAAVTGWLQYGSPG